jgi:predicted alpha/beta hydrolase family esterase
MKNAIILHGKPSKERYYDSSFPASSNYYWIPWLQKQLIVKNILTATPEIPNNWIADYPVWLKEFERYDVNSETILIGHSCGGGFLLRFLSEHPEATPSKVVLAAPWLNPKKLEETGDFFNFELDKLLAKRTNLSILYSDDDEQSVLDTVDILHSTYPDVVRQKLHGYGHFYDARRMEFPELLSFILK